MDPKCIKIKIITRSAEQLHDYKNGLFITCIQRVCYDSCLVYFQHRLGLLKLAGYENFFCNDGCIYHPLKHQRKHFIVYIYIFMHF
jgi:hypothetical protein